MRCFIAAWPTGAIFDELERFERPVVPRLRWTTPDQWHVTLRFLGELPDDQVPVLVDDLERALAGLAVPTAVAGPATSELGGQLVVPIEGIDDVAAAVVDASRPFGDEPERRRFRGHLTLGRMRRGATLPRDLLRQPFAGECSIDAVAVVQSQLDPNGARYEEVARVPLSPPADRG